MGEKTKIFAVGLSSRIFIWKRIDLEGNIIQPSLSAGISGLEVLHWTLQRGGYERL